MYDGIGKVQILGNFRAVDCKESVVILEGGINSSFEYFLFRTTTTSHFTSIKHHLIIITIRFNVTSSELQQTVQCFGV